MVYEIINDINKALDNEAYLSALTLALTLPDICGQAEYPTKNVGERYKLWFDEHIGKYEVYSDCTMPYLSGEVVYSLRCCMLHQGKPKIEKEKIKEMNCKIDKFTLIIEKKNPFDIYCDTMRVITLPNKCIEYDINVRRLCLIICSTANGYYNRNKEQFILDDYNIVLI